MQGHQLGMRVETGLFMLIAALKELVLLNISNFERNESNGGEESGGVELVGCTLLLSETKLSLLRAPLSFNWTYSLWLGNYLNFLFCFLFLFFSVFLSQKAELSRAIKTFLPQVSVSCFTGEVSTFSRCVFRNKLNSWHCFLFHIKSAQSLCTDKTNQRWP